MAQANISVTENQFSSGAPAERSAPRAAAPPRGGRRGAVRLLRGGEPAARRQVVPGLPHLLLRAPRPAAPGGGHAAAAQAGARGGDPGGAAVRAASPGAGARGRGRLRGGVERGLPAVRGGPGGGAHRGRPESQETAAAPGVPEEASREDAERSERAGGVSTKPGVPQGVGVGRVGGQRRSVCRPGPPSGEDQGRGPSAAGGQGARGGREGRAGRGGAGGGAGGAEEERRGDQPAPAERGRRPLPAGETMTERRKNQGPLSTLPLSVSLRQAAPPLCGPPAAGRHSTDLRRPAEAFGGARTALCHLRSRVEEVCRDEADKISRAVNENYVLGGECVTGGRYFSAENSKPAQTQPSLGAGQHTPGASFALSSLSLQPADQRMRAAFLRVSCGLSLDPDTAHPTLVLLEGPQGARCGAEPQSYPPAPQRFDSVAQVLCREGQSGGASYWEVEWRGGGGGWVDVGVTYRGIGRKGGGKPCLLGRNRDSWRLRCTRAGYAAWHAAWHANRKTTVAAPPCPRVGVLLERQKGALSFYSVSDAVVLLHTFRCAFSQPLCPAFRLDLDATLLLCPAAADRGSPGGSGGSGGSGRQRSCD